MANQQVEQLKSKILPILQEYSVRKAALFGSTARNTNTTASDVDLLVEIADDASLLDFIGLKQKLEANLNRSVDLVEYEALKPRLRDTVLKEQIPLL